MGILKESGVLLPRHVFEFGVSLRAQTQLMEMLIVQVVILKEVNAREYINVCWLAT